jgi:hypothetical protein
MVIWYAITQRFFHTTLSIFFFSVICHATQLIIVYEQWRKVGIAKSFQRCLKKVTGKLNKQEKCWSEFLYFSTAHHTIIPINRLNFNTISVIRILVRIHPLLSSTCACVCGRKVNNKMRGNGLMHDNGGVEFDFPSLLDDILQLPLSLSTPDEEDGNTSVGLNTTKHHWKFIMLRN